jgi:hypothetical protein
MSNGSPTTHNPYQTPKTLAEPPPVPTGGDFFRDGNFLVFRDRAELPMRCLINGEEVTPEAWRKRRLISWNPPWVFIGILGGILPILIMILIFQKKAYIVYSLGQRARSKMRNRGLVGLALLIAFVALLATGISRIDSNNNGGVFIIASIVAFFTGLIVLIKASPLKASGHRNGWFKMKGVSRDLLDQLPTGDWKSI